MRIALEVPDSNIANAIRGARMPWAKSTDGRFAFLAGDTVVFFVHEVGDGETDVTHRVTERNMRDAVMMLAHRAPEHFQYLMANRSDAETGNLLIQYACFGEQKYA